MSRRPAADSELARVTQAADSLIESHRNEAPMPSRLYHYTSLPAALEILNTAKIWCSNTRYSNDPSEADYGRLLLRAILKRDPDLRLTGFMKVLGDSECYAASFSAEPDLLPQWRAYCDNGRGVAVGVDSCALLARKSMLLVRVEYDRRRQRRLLRALLDIFRPAILAAANNSPQLMQYLEKLAGYVIIICASMKSHAYSSEKEYRLIDAVPANVYARRADVRFRATSSAIIPYLIGDLNEKRGRGCPNPVAEVRVGPCLDFNVVAAALTVYNHKHSRALVTTRSRVRMRA